MDNQICLHITQLMIYIYVSEKKNTTSVSSQLSGDQHGLLGIVLETQIYNNVIDKDFIEFLNPGTVSTILATSIEPYISEMVRNHQEQVREWQETVHIDQPLHHHLVAVFDDEYLQGFHNIHTDYVGITTQHIVEYLY